MNRPGAFAEYLVLPVTNVWAHEPGIDRDVQSIFDPFGNAVHTALHFPVLGEDVLVTGAGPIGAMAAAVVRHAGASYVVVTDVNPYRLEVAGGWASPWRSTSARGRSLPSSGNWGCGRGSTWAWRCRAIPRRFATCWPTWHGGKIAMLGIPSEELAIDWPTVIFNMLTIQGIYGREMYETWYKMTVMLQSGLDIGPVITHRFPYTEFQQGFDAMRTGRCGKVVLTWKDG